MSIEKITSEILRICKSDEFPYKENRDKIYHLFSELENIKIRDEKAIRLLISTHREISSIKNRKASYLEEEIGRLILVRLAFKIRFTDENIPKDIVETLEENSKPNDRVAIKLSSELLKYGKEIINSEADKSKRYKKRMKEAIRLLNELQRFYKIKGIKEILLSKIDDKDEDVQFFALDGLEIYYAHDNADKLTEEEEEKLEEIIESTDTRETASTCCQILMYSEKIDEFGALGRMDDWKDRNWNF